MTWQVVYTYKKYDDTLLSSEEISSITSIANPCIVDKTNFNETITSSTEGPFLGFTAEVSDDGKTLTVYESWTDRESYEAHRATTISPTDDLRKNHVPLEYSSVISYDISGRVI